MKRSLEIFFSVLLLHLLKIVSSTEFVPALIWTTNDAPETIPALHRVSEDSFKDALIDLLKKDPFVVVFAEHTLSPEDFAQKNEAGEIPFKGFSGLKKSYKVTYKPYVQNPIRAVKQLEKEVTEVSISSLLHNINVPNDNILIVDLNDAKDDEHRYDMLQRHDRDVLSIYNQLLKQHNNNVVAIYTGHHTSWVAPDEVINRKTRSLLAEEEKPAGESNNTQYIYFSTPGVFVAMRGPLQINHDNKTTNFTMEDIKVESGERKNSSSDSPYVIMSITATDLKIETNFSAVGQSAYWNISDVKVTFQKTEFVNLTRPNVYVPLRFSYHCGSVTFKFGRDSVFIPGYQVFPLLTAENITKDRFPDAYDCVGFTTVPIWSGIFVTFILLMILTFGLTMMMDIKTMDRFDDAKGKTLVINAAE